MFHVILVSIPSSLGRRPSGTRGYIALVNGDTAKEGHEILFRTNCFFSKYIHDIHHFFSTPPHYSVLSKVHQKVGKFATKYPKFAKIVQNFAFSMLQSTPARKKYNTTGSCGNDLYELCLRSVRILGMSSPPPALVDKPWYLAASAAGREGLSQSDREEAKEEGDTGERDFWTSSATALVRLRAHIWTWFSLLGETFASPR